MSCSPSLSLARKKGGKGGNPKIRFSDSVPYLVDPKCVVRNIGEQHKRAMSLLPLQLVTSGNHHEEKTKLEVEMRGSTGIDNSPVSPSKHAACWQGTCPSCRRVRTWQRKARHHSGAQMQCKPYDENHCRGFVCTNLDSSLKGNQGKPHLQPLKDLEAQGN